MKSPKVSPAVPYFAFVILALITLILFSQTARFEFLNFDDDVYVTKNPHLQDGFTFKGLDWAFEADLTAPSPNLDYWQPVTVISRLIDVQLFGLNAAAHHLGNVLFHLLNGLLLFFLFWKMTGAIWRSLLVALLFSIHPVQVEAVAWVTSRKDVLSVFFGLCCLLTYFFSISKKSDKSYWYSVLFCALSLLAKPIFVTMPALLLLIDFWPLGRFSGKGGRKKLNNIFTEKIPFVFLCAGMIILFSLTQSKDAMAYLPWPKVIWKTIVCYWDYVMFVFNPMCLGIRNSNFPQMLTPLHTALALGLWAGLLAGSWFSRKEKPYITFGILWFVISLLPSAVLPMMGDRYLYVPVIGLFVSLVWGISGFVQEKYLKKEWFVIPAIILFIFLSVRTWIQIGYWKNSETVFRRALAVSADDTLAMNNLGTALMDQGKFDEAKELFEKSIKLLPYYIKPYYNLGYLYAKQGKTKEAIAMYRLAILLDPLYAEAYNDLGTILIGENKLDEALVNFKKAAELKPIARAYNNIGFIMEKRNQLMEAEGFYEKALALDPLNAEAHNNVGISLVRRGNFMEALEHFETALRLRPNYPEATRNLQIVLIRLGKIKVPQNGDSADLGHIQLGNYS